MACGLCPGYFSVWYYGIDPTGGSTEGEWLQIPNIDSWNIEANVQEATKKRTSSTNGLAVKFCGDVVDYSASVVSTVCETNWLFCHILDGNDKNLMGETKTTWWYFGWGESQSYPVAPVLSGAQLLSLEDWRLNGATPPVHNNKGIFFYGKVTPPGFGGDNTSSDPTTASFSISVSTGPLLPSGSANPCNLYS